MYTKYLIIASKKDTAGVNITTQLSQFRQNPILSSLGNQPSFDFYLTEKEIVDDSGINMDKINNYDFVIFASKHQSEKPNKTLSIHAPGNWRNAELGGQAKKVCRTSALFMKQAFETLNRIAREHNLKDYDITMECTHHGPLINKPCMFIEIGSTENEWGDRRAGFIIAKTLRDLIQDFKKNPYHEIVFGIGGPHYCPNFNKIQLKSNFAVSHIIPQYSLPLTEEMVKEALEKTEEEIDFALLDWKGLGNSEQRKQVTDILDKLYVNYKRTSEISK